MCARSRETLYEHSTDERGTYQSASGCRVCGHRQDRIAHTVHGEDFLVRIFDLPRERTDQGFIDLVGRRLFAVFPLHLHGYIHRLMGTGGRGLLFVLLPLLCPQLALLPVRPERVNDRQVLVDTRLWVGHCARWHSTLQ